jgi:hypothetical protein
VWSSLHRQTGSSIETRVKEHQRHIRLKHLDKSAVAEHITNLGHRIQLQDTTILSTKSRYIDRVIREAIEIQLHLKVGTGKMAFVRAGHRSPASTLLKDVGSI